MKPLWQRALFSLDPETAHGLVKALRCAVPPLLLRQFFEQPDPKLSCEFAGLKFPSPIGLAAGFDKTGDLLPWLQEIGFGFLEVGSITNSSCPGNAKPRIVRLPKDQGIINWMGLPNAGADIFADKFNKLVPKLKIPIGINIVKTPGYVFEQRNQPEPLALDDWSECYSKIAKLGHYHVLNLSCPNTGETRTFEDPNLFQNLALEINKLRCSAKVKTPIFAKLSPDTDLETLKPLIKTALDQGFAGFVVGNTTRQRPKSLQTESPDRGGLSGKPLAPIATEQVRKVRQIAGKSAVIMACGGVMNTSDALEKINAGANLVQIYTGLIYGGPKSISRMNRQLILINN